MTAQPLLQRSGAKAGKAPSRFSVPTDPKGKADVLENRLKQMLERLSRSLYEAISDSDDVHVHLKQLRDEGYTLNLLLDCQPDLETRDDHPNLEPRTRRALHSSQSPAFKIDTKDLAILRSLGIDPTRPQKPHRTTDDLKASNGNYANGGVPHRLPPRPSIQHEAPLPPVGGPEDRPRDEDLREPL